MPGEHLLNTSFTLYQFDSLSLIGLGRWIQGSHWSVKESTSVIKCTDDSISAMTISFSLKISIADLTITNCNIALYLYNVATTFMWHVSIQNNSNIGLFYNSTFPILYTTILNCSFYQNCLSVTSKGRCAHATLNSYANQVTQVINGTSFSFGFELITALSITHYSQNRTEANELSIINSLFFNNTGIITGGFYANFSSILLQMNDTKFILNSVSNGVTYYNYAGAMAFTSSDFSSSKLYIRHCLFKNNYGIEVGGIYLILGCQIDDICLHIDHTTFESNVGIRGAALSIGSSSASMNLSHVSILSSAYPKHLPPNQYSALFRYCAAPGQVQHFVSLTNITLMENDMTALLSIGCAINFQEEESIIANNRSPLNGGGIWIDDQSTVTSSTANGNVVFFNNTAAGRGGALYSESNPFRLPQNLVDVFSLIPKYCQFTDIFAKFVHNKAGITGNDIYGGEFYNCFTKSIANNSADFIQLISCNSSWPVLSKLQRPLSPMSVSSTPFGACYCQNEGVINCKNRAVYISLYPGQWVTLPLVTVGLCGGISPGVLATESHGIHLTLINSNQQTLTSCKPFTYQLKQSDSNTTGGYYEVTTGTYNLEKSQLVVDVEFLQCPEGFQLKEGICTCDEIIESVRNVECNISMYPYHSITRSGNVWLSYDSQYNCTIAYHNCPFDYCNNSLVTFSLNESDLQCTQSRTGVLCGQCQPGLSLMLGSNQCGKCTDYYLSLIPVFAIMGLGLIFLLLTLNLTVSMGTINGLLFYANIMKLNEPVLFRYGGIPVLTQFISWLNLDFGFNVCFFNGLDGYWKTWLQFTFSLTLIVFIVVCCRYSGKLSRLFGRNVVSALSTLIFMAHTKILLTVRNALMIAEIKCGSTYYGYVWSVDGNIDYLSFKHIPLFLVSMIFLLTGLMYTLTVLCSQWLQYFCGKFCKCTASNPYFRLQPFIDAYTGPYKDKFRFFFGIRLVIYLVLTAIFSYTTGIAPQVNNYVTTFVSFVLLVFSSGKYKAKTNTALEFFYILNLGTTSLLNTINNDSFTFCVNAVSISLSLVVFSFTIVAHIFKAMKTIYGNKMTCFTCCKTYRSDSFVVLPNTNNQDVDEDNYSPSHEVIRRDSLIFDFKVTDDDYHN